MTDFEITFAPIVSQNLLIVCAFVVLVFGLLAIARGLSGWWLRLAGLAVLLLALMQPVFRQEERKNLSDIVFVVVDKTESQSVGVRPKQIEAGVLALQEEIGNLENFETRVIEIENDPSAVDDGSMVFTALSKAAKEVADSRIAGAILVTDGQLHDVDMLDKFPAPVHVVLTGETDDWDRRLVIDNAPAFAIVGEPVNIFLRVEDQGTVPANVADNATLRISLDGEDPREFVVEVGRQFELPLTLPHGGLNVLQF